MADLTDHVADAIFQSEDAIDRHLVADHCQRLAVVALQAARAQGWQIVKLNNEHVPTDDGAVYIAERWTG